MIKDSENCPRGIVSSLDGYSGAGVKKYRVPKIERPGARRTLCQMVLYAPVLFVKVTLYSVVVYGNGTLSYVGLPMFLHWD